MLTNANPAQVRLGSRKWYTVPVSMMIHSMAILALVVAPLVVTGSVPTPASVIAFMVTPPPPTPPPVATPSAPEPTILRVPLDPDAAPTSPASDILPEPVVRPPSTGLPGTQLPGGIPEHIIGTKPVAFPEAAAPPRPPDVPVRIGGTIKEPRKVRDALPVYPPIAQTAKIEGVVIIEALIGTSGQIENARILRSVPLLDQAALDAVRRWEYTPTMLNGNPVSVLMTVTVRFTLR